MEDYRERRKDTRFRVHNCVVRWTADGLLAFLRQHAGEHQLLDLSLGGLKFLTHEELPLRRPLHVTLHVPAYERPIHLHGEVAWCRPFLLPEGAAPAGGPMFQVGVRFTRVSDDCKRVLQRLQDDGKLKSLQKVLELESPRTAPA